MPKAIKAIKNLIIVKLPPNQAAGNWDIDSERVIEFARHFGITNPIHFRWTKGQRRVGSHTIRFDSTGQRFHAITINQWNSLEESQNTILHELCHAIQKDSVKISDWKTRRANERQMYGVWNSPIEVEARQFALDNMAEWGDVLYS